MEADVDLVMKMIAERTNTSASQLSSSLRREIENLVSGGTSDIPESEEVKAEKYTEGAATDMVVDVQDNGGGGGGGGGGGYPEPYDISAGEKNASEQWVHQPGDFVNTWVIAGGRVMGGPVGNAYDATYANKTLAVKCKMSQTYGQMSLVTYNNATALNDIQTEQNNERCVIVPLYKFGDLTYSEGSITGIEIKVDYRHMPFFDVWEMA